MARINLLPWRAERRKQREREFYMMLVATAAAAVLVFFCASYWMGMRIDNQDARNAYLEQQIKLLDKDIETIKNLEKVRSQLLARKEIIEDLQSNRSQMVHLFDQLSRTIPEGTRLTSLKQSGDKLTLEGVAESSTRVATYMRSLENSPYLGKSDLAKIESKEGTTGVDPKMPYVFSLSVTTKKTTEAEAAPAGSESAAPGGASKPGAKTSAPVAPSNDAASTPANKPASATAPAEEKKP
jgi:type IV pilus assembly protein PilN